VNVGRSHDASGRPRAGDNNSTSDACRSIEAVCSSPAIATKAVLRWRSSSVVVLLGLYFLVRRRRPSDSRRWPMTVHLTASAKCWDLRQQLASRVENARGIVGSAVEDLAPCTASLAARLDVRALGRLAGCRREHRRSLRPHKVTASTVCLRWHGVFHSVSDSRANVRCENFQYARTPGEFSTNRTADWKRRGTPVAVCDPDHTGRNGPARTRTFMRMT
jgi:hypothetical protein